MNLTDQHPGSGDPPRPAGAPRAHGPQGGTQLDAPTRLDAPEACARCGRTDRLIVGDGPSVCWRCVLGWRAASTIGASDEPATHETGCDHLRHVWRETWCPWCRALRTGGADPTVGDRSSPPPR